VRTLVESGVDVSSMDEHGIGPLPSGGWGGQVDSRRERQFPAKLGKLALAPQAPH
jgi:hypothetical protein